VQESKGGFGGFSGYGASRFDQMESFGSNYATPGWQRAQARRRGGFDETYDEGAEDAHGSAPTSPPPRGREEGSRELQRPRRAPLTIEGELVAKSTGTVSAFAVGDRVFHIKFGNGDVIAVEGNKLTIAFDKAGEKRVVDSFVQRA
jgi:DNA helicase-2/ATP-dependent DNA helicase PcrA